LTKFGRQAVINRYIFTRDIYYIGNDIQSDKCHCPDIITYYKQQNQHCYQISVHHLKHFGWICFETSAMTMLTTLTTAFQPVLLTKLLKGTYCQ